MAIRLLTSKDFDRYQAFIQPEIEKYPRSFGITLEEVIEYPFAIEKSGDAFTIADDTDGFLRAVGTISRIPGRVRRAHVAWLNRLVVGEEFRGQGLGRTILRAAVEQARRLGGLEHIKLCVMASNRTAISLYKSEGFQIYSLEKYAVRYGDEYNDEYQMILKL